MESGITDTTSGTHLPVLTIRGGEGTTCKPDEIHYRQHLLRYYL